MMGFAGQLSLGHAIYVGLGGYTAAALYVHYGVGPWIGLLAAIPVAMACGAVIGFLAFRFGVAGVYFAILTIAFAEFARIGFDHLRFVGGSAGFFLPVAQYTQNDLWNLRGKPVMFYYVILALTVMAFLLCHALLRSRIGYFWLAIREDEEAARALGIDTFRYKMAAVVISAGMTAVAGVFFAFYYNNLFPEQVFHISRSIEIILAPIIGGIGTLFGPVLGAFVLTGLSETMTELLHALGIEVPGRQAGVLRRLPARRRDDAAGRHLAVARAPPQAGAAPMSAFLAIDGVSKRFRGLVAVDRVACEVAQGEIFAVIGPNGAGKTTLFNMIAGALRPDEGAITLSWRAHRRAASRRDLPARHRAHVPDRAAVSGADRGRQRDGRRAAAHRRRRARGAQRRGGDAPARPVRQARAAREVAHACPTASGSRSRARSRPRRSCCCSTR